MAEMVNVLAAELIALEGIHSQNPDTGAGIDSGTSYLSQYTNRLFGAPFQFMDSVDRRFSEVNTHLGNEYLRNIILNSPILRIKPGMPIYTGGATSDSIFKMLNDSYLKSGGAGNLTFIQALLEEAVSSTVFSTGSKLQKRMFGFRETYYQYIQHVNYMCRSMAVYLNLTTGEKFPKGTYCSSSSEMLPFETFKWENYRMLTSVQSMKPSEYLEKLGRATVVGSLVGIGVDVVTGIAKGIGNDVKSAAKAINEVIAGGDTTSQIFSTIGVGAAAAAGTVAAAGTIGLGLTAGAVALVGATSNGSEIKNDVINDVKYFMNTNPTDVIVDKATSVMFMIEPSQYEETFTNRTKESMLAASVDAITNGIGHELAFVTNSNVDFGILDNITSFLGNSLQTATSYIAGLVKPVTGGFVTNLFNGAMQAVTGQKMIYPKIYEGSESSRNYNFTVKLVSPYGDIYNYYMNIVIPLMHLLSLVAPRMVTSNTIASPYLVQAFVPGICTCNLGIVSNMTVSKNPNSDRVSVHGFPLEVEVKFTIEELYNSFSISPCNDPAAFLFNETLNDYMANLGGLTPSTDTYTKQRKSMLESLNTYFKTGDYIEDIANDIATKIETYVNPAIQAGS